MSDALKDFVQKNQQGFKEKPSEDLWEKIDATLKQESVIYKSKNISAMLKYGFSASIIIIAGTFALMNLQNEKTGPAHITNKPITVEKFEIPVNPQADASTFNSAPIKKRKTLSVLKKLSDSIATEPTNVIPEIIIPSSKPQVLHASHPPVRDSLDINNWPCAGNQRKKYSLSAENISGKTIGCIKSVSKNINGFITMMQSNLPDKYLGKRIRMTGYLKTENVTEWAGLWMRVGVKGGDEALAFDNMRYGKKDRSVKGTTERTKYEVVLDVPINSANIIYGVMLVGTGQMYFDSFILEIVDDSVPTTGGNPDELNLYKIDSSKSYNPRNFWRWYVTRRIISKDGTSNIDLEPNNF